MNKALIKKGFIVGLIGFAVGVPVGLAFLLMNASEEHSVTFIALQLILSGVLGGIALGSSVVYEAESWSVTRCTVTHFVVTFATYFTIGFSMGWFPLDDIGTYIMIGSMFVAYFMIWLIMYLISKKQAKELDEELKAWKQSGADEKTGSHDMMP